jgi:hypothetical protein
LFNGHIQIIARPVCKTTRRCCDSDGRNAKDEANKGGTFHSASGLARAQAKKPHQRPRRCCLSPPPLLNFLGLIFFKQESLHVRDGNEEMEVRAHTPDDDLEHGGI